MSFRRKLLFLLLMIALVPLLINSLLHRATMQRIRKQLMTDTKEVLEKNAINQLQVLLNHQALLLEKEQVIFLQAIIAQKREIENQLAILDSPAEVKFTDSYLSARRPDPDLFLWHATFLNSGQISVFPRGSLPAKEVGEWEKRLNQTRKIDWNVDYAKSPPQITISSQVFNRKGEPAGFTLFAIDYRKFINDWQLPPPWNENGRLFVVSIKDADSGNAERLKVLLEVIKNGSGPSNTLNSEERYRSAAPDSSTRALIEKATLGGSGYLNLEFDHQETIWIYAVAEKGKPFPLLLIPRRLISLPADHAADYVDEYFVRGLKLTGLLTFFVLVWVILTAIYRSRAVTRPIDELYQTAGELSQGNFSAQVDIRSGDEFEELGSAFNQVGPQLKERQEIKQSLAVARDIQQLILPGATPDLENFDISCRLDYCDETGGDYYDFIKTDSDKWGLAVGDVVGHGVGSALIMASAAGILNAAIANGEKNLTTIFSTLNSFLVGDIGDTRLMTLFLALIDPSRRTLQWLSAGHGPMFFYRADSGQIEELSATTMPLGVMDTVEFSPVESISFASGDMLAIGTDGVWEAANSEGEMFGPERVGCLLKDLAHLPVEQIVDEVLMQVSEFCGSAPVNDDLTLMVLKAR